MKCERCMYRARPHAGYQCDYYAITGHTRRAVPPKEAGSRRMIYDWEKAGVLYRQGESDGAISRELGCTSKAVGNWRKRMGLPPNYQQGMQKRKP